MANLFGNNQPRQPLASRPLNTPARPVPPPPRFSSNNGVRHPASREGGRQFDRGDKPFQTPPAPPKTVNYAASPNYRPFTATPIPPKRMISSGITSAANFQKPATEPSSPTPMPPAPPPSHEAQQRAPAKTILPPKSFRARRMSPALTVALIVIAALVAAGLTGYFVFPREVKTTYRQVLVAVGIEETSPAAGQPAETVTVTPRLATLDDITFTETTDPDSGTAVEPGERITYTLTLHNTAVSDVSGLAVSDAIPPATERLTVLSTPTGSQDNSSDTSVEIANITLKGGQTQLVRFQVTVKNNLAAGDTIANTATLAMNGSRKVSNNNTPSSLALATTLTPIVTPVPEETPVVTPTPAVTPTPTPTATAAVTITPTPTPAPEESGDQTAPEDQTTVETGGNPLVYLFVFMALTISAGIALIFFRRQATS